jgi:hypothetical protein
MNGVFVWKQILAGDRTIEPLVKSPTRVVISPNFVD